MRMWAVVVGFALAPSGLAQQPVGVPQAIEKGVAFLRQTYARPAVGGAAPGGGLNINIPGMASSDTTSPGTMSLAGLAMLEGGAPPTDPAVVNIAQAVRAAIIRDSATYHIALAILFLDRLRNPADVPLIQVLGIRLYAGMTRQGGWPYDCSFGIPDGVIAGLIAGAQRNQLADTPNAGRPQTPKGAEGFPTAPGGAAPPADKSGAGLHPAARAYLGMARSADRTFVTGDNSNTQFGLIGLWVAARNGVPAEDAFALIERRFLTTQSRADFGWGYDGAGMTPSTPAMTCAGLLGLAVGAARGGGTQNLAPQPASPPAAGGPNDLFANPPKPANPKAADALPADRRKAAVAGAFRGLEAVIKASGGNLRQYVGLGDEYYLLWSVERAAVAYGLATIGDADWYTWGCNFLLPAQQQTGAWHGSYSAEVDTSFAILFLTKSNVVSDLTGKIGRPETRDLRGSQAGKGLFLAPPPPGGHKGGSPPGPGMVPGGSAGGPVGGGVAEKTESDKIADALVNATGAAWAGKLREVYEGKGTDFTVGLAKAIDRLDAVRQKEARDTLAERLSRFTAATIRGNLRSDDPELRRAACLAAAMKDDKGFVPDLIIRITDPADLVVRAARAGLKSLTGLDHGPQPNADDAAKQKAQADWRAATAKK
jgi:hypothetical protein